MHYNTKIFDSITGVNSFNLGMKGATPQVSFAGLKAYLVNSVPPEYLFYEVDYHFLKFRSEEVKEFNNYFPFLRNPVLRKEFSQIDKRMEHFYINPYYSFPYTGLKNISTSLHGWLNIPNRNDNLYYKGYLKEAPGPDLSFEPSKRYYSWFDVKERAYLDSIIVLCKKNNIHLTLVSSPIFGGGEVELKNKKQILRQLRNIAFVNSLQYFDLSSLPFCSQRNLFTDHFHMNPAGAAIFTEYFSGFIHNKLSANTLK
jgi:hypothetical protein